MTIKGDAINHPSHYNAGKYEVIDVIEDWRLNFNLGNSIKYIARAHHKGDPISDLRKAKWYLEREINRMQSSRYGGVCGTHLIEKDPENGCTLCNFERTGSIHKEKRDE